MVRLPLPATGRRRQAPAETGRLLAWRRSGAGGYGPAVARALSAAVGGLDHILGGSDEAAALCRDLLRFDPPQRRVVVANCRRYLSLPVCEQVLDEALRRASDDPAAAREMAELTLELTGRLEPPAGASGLLADLQARAWACLANAHRAAGEPRRAALAFRLAEARLADGTGDPLAEAEILRLKTLLAESRGARATAEALLEREIAIHEATGHPDLLGRALLHRACLCARRGELEEAVRHGRRAVAALDRGPDRPLTALASQQLARCLALLGRPLEAQRWHAAARRLGADLDADFDQRLYRALVS